MKSDNKTWNELRKHGVNYDFIITLNKKEDGTLERIDYPITCLNPLFNRLEKLFNNDEFYDVVDMEKAILREINIKKLDICIPHEYRVRYINDPEHERSISITYETIDQKKELTMLKKKKNYILSKHKQRLRIKNKELSISEIDTRAFELTNEEYKAFLHEEKIKFLRKRMGYLHAYAYEITYNSISKDVFFISSERIGWPSNKEKGNPTWIYKINDDIKVSLWSNFCYGDSSAFYIRIFYKGLQLCPYSEFVTYRYARESDILNYTRKYELERASWGAAADFVLSFCNKAIADPNNFIREEITYEVRTLVHELSQIVFSKEQYLKTKFETSATQNNRFSHVANLTTFNEYQLADYQQNPAEYELLFRMEKISGALKFVNSLEQFSTIFKFIRRAIVKIEDLNAEIYPELMSCIIPIRKEVAELRDDVQKLSREYDILKKKAELHYVKIKNSQNRLKDSKEKDVAKKEYYQRHPELEELENMRDQLHARLQSQSCLLKKREIFLNSLESSKSRIEAYGIPDLDY